MKKLLKGLIAIGICASLAAVPMIVNADPAPLDAAGAEVENANKDATTITVKQTVPRVDYVSNVVYKQINTPNSHQSLVLNMLLPKLKDNAPAPVVMFVKGSGFTAMNLDGFMQQRMYLAQKGFAVIEAETRVVPQATFPAQTIDLKAAIRFVRAHAEEFNLDVKKIGADETVLIDPMKMNYALYKSLPCKVAEGQNPTILMKAMKNPVEIENIKKAELKDSVALTKFIYWVKNNYDKQEITELSASDKLTSLRQEQEGYIRDSFEPLQAFGEHAAMMHYSPSPETDVVLKEGEMLLSDTGGGYFEGSTDITRTTVLGHIEPEMKKYYTAVFRAMQHLSAANFLYGNHGWSLDVLCRQPVWDLNKDFQCGTGHGFGYLGSIHEPPTGFRWYIVPSKNEHHQFEEGMCVTIEPGIYEEGEFGIRIENNVVTVKGEKNKYGQFMHFETLSFVPIDLDAIDPEELTRSEREWLNEYHAECYEKLSPFMTDEENEWLKKYTRKI